jgi:pyrrolidone-carboxylate peptidase
MERAIAGVQLKRRTTGGRGSLATVEVVSGSSGPLCHESFLPVRVAAWSVATAGVPAAVVNSAGWIT